METPNQTAADAEKQKMLYAWQKKLLPWLITTPSILILLFIGLATYQVSYFNKALDVKDRSATESLLLTDTAKVPALKKDLDYVKWMTITKMEEESLHKRYHQGGLLLLSRIFIKYLGFLTGMILAIVGAIFIIGKLSEDVTKLEGSAGEKMKFSLISSSPGIIFGILGSSLMIATILQHKEVTVEDTPLYLNAYGINALRDGLAPDTSGHSDEKLDTSKAADFFGH